MRAASAIIAKIPFPLAQWIARCFKPDESERGVRDKLRAESFRGASDSSPTPSRWMRKSEISIPLVRR
jgi:hypothetical protein